MCNSYKPQIKGFSRNSSPKISRHFPIIFLGLLRKNTSENFHEKNEGIKIDENSNNSHILERRKK